MYCMVKGNGHISLLTTANKDTVKPHKPFQTPSFTAWIMLFVSGNLRR
jgi:hypothetical protein